MTLKIVDQIITHKNLYELSSQEIPIYRLTCGEHKILADYLKKSFPCFKNKFGMVSEFMGVRLQIVMVVEPYT